MNTFSMYPTYGGLLSNILRAWGAPAASDAPKAPTPAPAAASDLEGPMDAYPQAKAVNTWQATFDPLTASAPAPLSMAPWTASAREVPATDGKAPPAVDVMAAARRRLIDLRNRQALFA